MTNYKEANKGDKFLCRKTDNGHMFDIQIKEKLNSALLIKEENGRIGGFFSSSSTRWITPDDFNHNYVLLEKIPE